MSRWEVSWCLITSLATASSSRLSHTSSQTLRSVCKSGVQLVPRPLPAPFGLYVSGAFIWPGTSCHDVPWWAPFYIIYNLFGGDIGTGRVIQNLLWPEITNYSRSPRRRRKKFRPIWLKHISMQVTAWGWTAVAGRHSFFRAVESWSLDCQRWWTRIWHG